MKEGDVVRFDYTLWLQGGHALETSMEEKAKELGIQRQEKRYRPLTITVGRQQILPALEARLKDAQPGQPLVVDLPAKEAYGERDPTRIKDVPMAQFKRQKIDPRVGMELNFQGQRGVVTRVAGGRVRIDLNHDLAGKDLRYEVVVRDVLTDPAQKVEAVCAGIFPGGGHKVSLDDHNVTLEVPDAAKFDQEWPMHKFRVLSELRAVTGTKLDIVLVERYPANPGGAAGAAGAGALAGHEGHGHEGHSHEEE